MSSCCLWRGIIAICRSSKNSWLPAHQNHILMAMCCSPKISLLSAVYTKVRGHLLFGEGASLLSTCQWMTRGQLLVKMDFMVSYFSNLNWFTGCPQPVERPLPRCIGARTRFCGSLPRCASRRAVVARIAFPRRQLVQWDYAYPKARRTRAPEAPSGGRAPAPRGSAGSCAAAAALLHEIC